MLRDLRDVGIARIGDTTGRFTVRLYVRNPAFEPLRIPSGGPPYRFAADPAESQGLSFSLRIASASSALQAGPGVDFWGAPAYVFEPRQTQVTEHEISLREWAARGAPLEPGTYRVRSYFNGHEGGQRELPPRALISRLRAPPHRHARRPSRPGHRPASRRRSLM